MKREILDIQNLSQAKKELSQIKAEEVSIDIMAPKAVFRVVKLFDVHPAAANIIKQEMLAIGGETAVARGCVNMSVEKSDIIIMGTLKQYKKLLAKLKMQKGYFGLNEIIEELTDIIEEMSK
ncbi:conserved hypothetical protein [Thermoanaerobacter mathranii subsp. mathranii str. A3]|jgi:hypothetical protein|uniref:Dihydropteroate synthase n=3 Tax=Thermoanaerobacter TaxID=1754 RepID=D3T4Z4_THEIA|nr:MULTISPECIES: hypothetical protein [Thermoanaerobacter]MDK2814365.1 hypothetical protein [Thermoanaerobacter sp.]ADD03287.1 conserved hypothetical protein [Thermoanaerobacter italicus Ab9]ADH61693.1 conserved hypothetical protein [Thermoanaerobacter mathranii subsp. mathranii str. A3]MBT1278670.1 hypothetical protein [Thermoanaerobacter sp. CM-CNRG TB177]MDP9751597.1 hypothetical protein [Thermoanaerobacter pentosaceus]